jgi:hypothetical protein
MTCFRKPFEVSELLAEVERLDLLAVHRKRLARWEKERKDAFAGAAAPRRRRARAAWYIAACVAVCLGVGVPMVAGWLGRAAEAARSAVRKTGEALDSASRIEGYLERDEQRELLGR